MICPARLSSPQADESSKWNDSRGPSSRFPLTVYRWLDVSLLTDAEPSTQGRVSVKSRRSTRLRLKALIEAQGITEPLNCHSFVLADKPEVIHPEEKRPNSGKGLILLVVRKGEFPTYYPTHNLCCLVSLTGILAVLRCCMLL
jgi:hypothetical protein